MEIKITKVLEKTVNGFMVWFETKLGSGKSEWNGEAPTTGITIYVDLKIIDELVLGINLIKIKSKESFIDCKDDKLIIQGEVGQIQDDDTEIIINFQYPYKIRVQSKNPKQIKSGDFVRIIVKNIRIFGIDA